MLSNDVIEKQKIEMKTTPRESLDFQLSGESTEKQKNYTTEKIDPKMKFVENVQTPIRVSW